MDRRTFLGILIGGVVFALVAKCILGIVFFQPIHFIEAHADDEHLFVTVSCGTYKSGLIVATSCDLSNLMTGEVLTHWENFPHVRTEIETVWESDERINTKKMFRIALKAEKVYERHLYAGDALMAFHGYEGRKFSCPVRVECVGIGDGEIIPEELYSQIRIFPLSDDGIMSGGGDHVFDVYP